MHIPVGYKKVSTPQQSMGTRMLPVAIHVKAKIPKSSNREALRRLRHQRGQQYGRWCSPGAQLHGLCYPRRWFVPDLGHPRPEAHQGQRVEVREVVVEDAAKL